MEEMETHPNPFGKPTEMRHSQKTSLAMGEYPQGILAWANTRKGYWRISKSGILTRSITNERLISAGYPSVLNLYIKLHRS